jgi:hypothetical protein
MNRNRARPFTPDSGRHLRVLMERMEADGATIVERDVK